MQQIKVVKVPTRRLDATAASTLRGLIEGAFVQGATVLVLDMSEVAYIDSLGLSVLVVEHRRRPEGTRIVLAGMNEYVREVCEITQMYRLFDVYETASAALASHARRHAQAST